MKTHDDAPVWVKQLTEKDKEYLETKDRRSDLERTKTETKANNEA